MRSSWGWLLLITLIWGYTWVPMKVALEVVGPFTFSLYRFVLGACCLMGILFWQGALRVSRRDLPWLALLGGLQTTGAFGFWMVGMQTVSAGMASILAYTMPLWTVLLARIGLGERLTRNRIAGVGAGLAGLYLVMDPGYSRVEGTVAGMLWILAGAVSWAASNVLVKARFADHDKIAVTGYQMAFGSLGLLILAWWFDPDLWPKWSLSFVGDVLFTGVLSSAVAFVAWFHVLSRMEAGRAAVSLLLVPVFAVGFGWWLLDETVTWNQLAGAVLVMLGVAAVHSGSGFSFRKRRRNS